MLAVKLVMSFCCVLMFTFAVALHKRWPYVSSFLPMLLLFAFERRRQQLPLATRLRFALHIADGMAYLHARQILHRDLKSLNVLVRMPNSRFTLCCYHRFNCNIVLFVVV